MATFCTLLASIIAWVAYRLLWLTTYLQPSHSNCNVWAFRQQRLHGGYVVLMPSRYYWWHHAVYTTDFQVFHQFVADGYRGRRLIPPFVFKGHAERWNQTSWERLVGVV